MSNSLSSDATAIRRLLTVTDRQVEALAELLIDCVDGGASVMLHAPPVQTLPIGSSVLRWSST